MHVEVKGEDDVRLLRPQGHRSPRNCPEGYHRKPALLQGMSTSTSSTLLQILGRLISRVKRIRRDRWETKSWMLDHDQRAGACCHQCQAVLGREAGRSAWAPFVLTSSRSLWLLAIPKHEVRRQGNSLWVVAWQWRGCQTWGHKRRSGKERNCSSGVSLGTHHCNMLQINIVYLTSLWILHPVGRTTSPVTFLATPRIEGSIRVKLTGISPYRWPQNFYRSLKLRMLYGYVISNFRLHTFPSLSFCSL